VAARLSVCMIVRDESAVLGRCLESLQGLVDELCIVDTGSVDDTPTIARRHGARVALFTACNDEQGRIVDFALARNAALAMATGEWVLQIDADEILEAGADRVRHWLEAGDADCVGIRMKSGSAEWVSQRLFRRALASTYHSRIHEYVECGGVAVRDLGIRIVNLQDKRGKESSSERNRRLCELALAEDPDDARILFYLAGENRKAGRLEEAVAQFARCVELGTYRQGLYRATFQLGACHLMLGRWTEAMEAARAAIALDARYAEGYCLLADACSCSERLDDARRHYEAALACSPPADALFPIESWAYGAHPRRRLEAMGVTPA
jgi:glycosyltransferase involved in cell wall biosynthesis